MARKAAITIIPGIYFILIDFPLLAHGYYPKADSGIKNYLYQRGQKRQAEMTRIMARGQFSSENAHEMFIKHYKDLQAAIIAFKQGSLEKLSVVALLTSLAGTLTGVNLFRRSKFVNKMTLFIFSLWALYLGLYMWNACLEIRFLDYTSVVFRQMASFFKPDMGDLRHEPLVKSLIDFSVTRTAVFAFVWVIFYLIIPLYCMQKVRFENFGKKRKYCVK